MRETITVLVLWTAAGLAYGQAPLAGFPGIAQPYTAGGAAASFPAAGIMPYPYGGYANSAYAPGGYGYPAAGGYPKTSAYYWPSSGYPYAAGGYANPWFSSSPYATNPQPNGSSFATATAVPNNPFALSSRDSYLSPPRQDGTPPGPGVEDGHTGEPPQINPAEPRLENGPAPQTPAARETLDGSAPVAAPLRNRFWGSAEYVSWWVQGANLPPLATSSPAGTPLASAGVLGQPGTTTLFGNELVNNTMRPGARFVLGFWFDDAGSIGLEAGLMMIGGGSTPFTVSSNGSQILARPFTDATTGLQSSELVSYPGMLSGSQSATYSTDPLLIADLALRSCVCCGCWGRVDVMAGYRYAYFGESLQIQENLTSLDPLALGAHFLINDSFVTRNVFQGGMVGVNAEFDLGPFTLDVFGKLALGNMHNEVTISGSTVITVPGSAPMSYPGGLLALPSNMGTYTANNFVIFPELGVTLGYRVTNWLRLTVGYSFLWLPDVVRPGDQVNLNVNPNLLPPANATTLQQPSYTMRQTDMWIQGVRVGFEVRY